MKPIEPAKVIYINGLRTSEAEADHNRRALEKFLGVRVRLCFNPTLLWVSGLLECFIQRWLWWLIRTPQVVRIHRAIREEMRFLGAWEPLYIIGHSQGCLQAINAVRLLDPMDRLRVRLILFACPAAFELKDVETEYWRNTGDWVLSNLIRTRKYESGFMYHRPGRGHAFTTAYLAMIHEFKRAQSEKDYRASMFWKLREEMKGGEND